MDHRWNRIVCFKTNSHFATNLLRNRDAVVTAMEQPWSNGQLEGQINRLKILKRQMYGRANINLLECRMVNSP
jgi:transposase